MYHNISYDDAFDLHIHTLYSLNKTGRFTWNDGVSSPQEIVKFAKKIGLKGLAITDHETISGVRSAQNEAKRHNIIVIPGYEIITSDRFEILVLGMENLIRSDKTLEEVVEEVHENCGIVVKAHPISSIIKNFILPFDHYEKFDAFEINAVTPIYLNNLLENKAKERGIKLIGGSDSHNYMTLGGAVTLFRNEIYDVDSAIDSIKKGMAKAKHLYSGYCYRFYVYLERLKLLFSSKGKSYKKLI